MEPFLPENPSIQHEYAPIYSLWRSDKNPKTGAASQSLLWNLYRRQTTPNSRTVSACFGLYQHEVNPAGKRLRLFYIPLSAKPPPRAPSSSSAREQVQNAAKKWKVMTLLQSSPNGKP